jgi:hypothetical protein
LGEREGIASEMGGGVLSPRPSPEPSGDGHGVVRGIAKAVKGGLSKGSKVLKKEREGKLGIDMTKNG